MYRNNKVPQHLVQKEEEEEESDDDIFQIEPKNRAKVTQGVKQLEYIKQEEIVKQEEEIKEERQNDHYQQE